MSFLRSPLLPIAALALAACSTTPGPDQPGALGPGSDRVVVAPLNLTVRAPEELDGKGDPVWEELLQTLQARDKSVAFVAPPSARALWIEATGDLDLSDRSLALETARSRFAQLLATHRDYDVLVVPSLVLRAARVWGRHATWDGVRRSALEPSEAADLELGGAPPGIVTSGVSGSISAVSLHVAVLDPEGRLLYEGVGGLALARSPHRRGKLGGWTLEPREEPFADREELREGIEIALAMPAARP